jgi:hypothetical protein
MIRQADFGIGLPAWLTDAIGTLRMATRGTEVSARKKKAGFLTQKGILLKI